MPCALECQGLLGATLCDARDMFIKQRRFDLATERATAEPENGFVTGQSGDGLVDLLTPACFVTSGWQKPADWR